MKSSQLPAQVDDTHVVKSVLIEAESACLFGLQKNSVAIKNDIIAPIEEDWDTDK